MKKFKFFVGIIDINSDFSNFEVINMPIVRRVVARTILNDLVTVRPLTELYGEFPLSYEMNRNDIVRDE